MSIKLSKCQSNFQNVNQNFKMSTKLSKCQSNGKNVNQIVNMSIKGIMTTRLYYDQSMWIRLAHRLYSDFQYFFFQICQVSNPFRVVQTLCRLTGSTRPKLLRRKSFGSNCVFLVDRTVHLYSLTLLQSVHCGSQ